MKLLILFAICLVVFVDVLVWSLEIETPNALHLFYGVILTALTVALLIASKYAWPTAKPPR